MPGLGLLWKWIAALCAVGAAGLAQAGMGPLQPLLSAGTDGAWTGTLEGEGYRLENRQQPGAIHYVYGPVAVGSEGRREIGVSVALAQAEAPARAGLVYGFDPAQRSYWLLVLGPGGEVEWIRRDAEGFRTVLARSTGRRPAGPVPLVLQERGRSLTLRVAGEVIATLESDALGRGAAGIVAIGRGRFQFSGYGEQASGPAPAATGRATPGVAGQSSRLVEHTIADPFGFEQPMPAVKVSVPEGWTLDGSMRWERWSRCWVDQNKLHFVARAPDGRQRFEFIPGGSWQWHSEWAALPQLAQQQQQRTGCQPRPITDGRRFMQAYVQALRPGAQVVSMALDREETEGMARQIAQEPVQPGQQRWGEAWAVGLRYAGEGGETVHEHLSTGLVFHVMPAASMSGAPARFLFAMALGTGSTLAVGREPDMALSRRIVGSVKLLPAYAQRLRQHQQQMAGLQAAALQRERQAFQAAQAARMASTSSSSTGSSGSSVLDSSHESWKRRQGWIDGGQAKVVDATHERTAWTTTSGGVQYLPQRYQRAYQLPGEQYVGSNDAFFNPMQGTALQRQP